jgi:2-haloacid dehalogenase
VVAFDIMETVFSLESLRERFVVAGCPGSALDLWYAHILRDGLALNATGIYTPFAEVASSSLPPLFAQHGLPADPAAMARVLAGFAALLPHADAEAAFRHLRSAGIRILALTNGNAQNTQTLFRSAGLDRFVERIVSVEEVQQWKPRREVYLHAARCAGVEPQDCALVATHAWDIHGAGCAGLTTGFVSRGRPFPGTMMTPHVVGESLIDVARELVQLG